MAVCMHKRDEFTIGMWRNQLDRTTCFEDFTCAEEEARQHLLVLLHIDVLQSHLTLSFVQVFDHDFRHHATDLSCETCAGSNSSQVAGALTE